MKVSLFFNRRWWWTTLLALAAVLVMARLGIWQLDRLTQRRAFNERVLAQIHQSALSLVGNTPQAPLPDMEYREVIVVGHYDWVGQVALRNQVWGNRSGVHLLTPLVIEGSNQAVLVDRGWIPAADAPIERWSKYNVADPTEVHGVIRRSQPKPDFGGVPDPEGRLKIWNTVNVERIGQQLAQPLLPIYIQALPDPGQPATAQTELPPKELPARSRPDLDLSEGTHLGYALQWFAFAMVLALGYPRYVIQTSRPPKHAQPIQSETALQTLQGEWT